MQQRNFLCPKLGLGGGAGAVWEELDNERERWQDPHSYNALEINALEINALSIGRLCIVPPYIPIAKKSMKSMKMTHSSFFTPNTLFLNERQTKVFQSYQNIHITKCCSHCI